MIFTFTLALRLITPLCALTNIFSQILDRVKPRKFPSFLPKTLLIFRTFFRKFVHDKVRMEHVKNWFLNKKKKKWKKVKMKVKPINFSNLLPQHGSLAKLNFYLKYSSAKYNCNSPSLYIFSFDLSEMSPLSEYARDLFFSSFN